MKLLGRCDAEAVSHLTDRRCCSALQLCRFKMPREKQLALDLRTWGGRRRGAGRKPRGDRSRVSHGRRPRLSRHHPVHVTWRMLPHVWNLARGLQGLAVRIARRLNQMMGRTGKVFADRYHAHILRSPAEVASAVAYVLGNFVVHALRRGDPVSATALDPYSSAFATRTGPPLVARPETWLLRIGWRRGGATRQSAELDQVLLESRPDKLAA